MKCIYNFNATGFLFLINWTHFTALLLHWHDSEAWFPSSPTGGAARHTHTHKHTTRESLAEVTEVQMLRVIIN